MGQMDQLLIALDLQLFSSSLFVQYFNWIQFRSFKNSQFMNILNPLFIMLIKTNFAFLQPCSMGFATGGKTFFLWGGCMMASIPYYLLITGIFEISLNYFLTFLKYFRCMLMTLEMTGTVCSLDYEMVDTQMT